MKKSLTLLIAILLGIGHLPAANQAPGEVRVVSLSPGITEIIYQLKQEKRLIGRSSACDYPAAALKLPIVGTMTAPFAERLAALKPDYVLTSGFRDGGVKNMIEKLGVKVVILPGRTLQDYVTGVKTIGEILHCRDAAAAEINRFECGLAEFRRAAVNPEVNAKPRVYLEVWHRPLQTCGGKSFITEMIDYAGGVNVAGKEPQEYFPCSEEWVFKQNPEIIIAPSMGSGKSVFFESRRGWKNIAAVMRHRVYTGLNQSEIFRLGPRTLAGIAQLRQCIYGEDKK